MSTTVPLGSEHGATVTGGTSPATAALGQVREAIGVGLIILGAWLGAGVLAGIVWMLVAPTVPCTITETGCTYTFEGGRFFIAEGIFGALMAAIGVVAAIVARHRIRRHGWPIAVALAVGGLLASVVAWRVGVWLGPTEPAVAAFQLGEVLELPLRLRTSALLLAGSIGSLVVALWITMSSVDDVIDGWAFPSHGELEPSARS